MAGDGAALLEADFVGTHIGTIGGIAPTGRDVKVSCCVCDEQGEHISALRASFPVAALKQQVSGDRGAPA